MSEAENYKIRVQAALDKYFIKGAGRCPVCGFKGFRGGVHPLSGVHGRTKELTSWCNGKMVIRRRDPHTILFDCPRCKRMYQYPEAEAHSRDIIGMCRECEKEFQKAEEGDEAL